MKKNEKPQVFTELKQILIQSGTMQTTLLAVANISCHRNAVTAPATLKHPASDVESLQKLM